MTFYFFTTMKDMKEKKEKNLHLHVLHGEIKKCTEKCRMPRKVREKKCSEFADVELDNLT